MKGHQEQKEEQRYKAQLALVLGYLVEGDNKKANKLLHEIIVEKAKKQNENL